MRYNKVSKVSENIKVALTGCPRLINKITQEVSIVRTNRTRNNVSCFSHRCSVHDFLEQKANKGQDVVFLLARGFVCEFCAL